MLEPPAIAGEAILSALHEGYGLQGASMAFMPLGYDTHAWAYQLHAADGSSYFLKLRDGPPREPALALTRWLVDQGVSEVVAPLFTREGRLWVSVGEFSLTLYPFIRGRTGAERGMEDRHWTALGAFLRALHAVEPAALPQVRLATEAFESTAASLIREVQARIDAGSSVAPLEPEMVAMWREHRDEIEQVTTTAEELGRRLRNRPCDEVLCHGDIHAGNILFDDADHLFVIDWDDPLVAPKERDLMFTIGGVLGPEVAPNEDAFFRGYGETAVDPLLLAYYRHDWAVQDIADFAARVLLMPEAGVATRQDACRMFAKLFAPGCIVPLARAARHALES